MSTFFLEGGDVVLHKNDNKTVYFVGQGSRTNKAGFDYLQKNISHQSIALTLINPVYYHLDTCFLPVKDILLVAEPLHTLFSKDSIELIKSHFKEERIVVAAKYSKLPWTCCNARFLSKKGALIFSCRIPDELSALLQTLLQDVSLEYLDLQSLMVGGGGLACATLLDEDEEIIIITHPTHCDLTKYVLNTFQRDMQQKKESKTDLLFDYESIYDTFTRHGLKVITLPSHENVPECVFIKDVCILTRNNGVLIFILCETSVKERQAEKQWFVNALEGIREEEDEDDEERII